MCVSSIRESHLDWGTFAHRLFLQAPGEQKGREKEYKTEIQKSKDVNMSINCMVPLSADSSEEKVCSLN